MYRSDITCTDLTSHVHKPRRGTIDYRLLTIMGGGASKYKIVSTGAAGAGSGSTELDWLAAPWTKVRSKLELTNRLTN